MSAPTQTQRVLAYLQTCGVRGTTQLEWDGPTPDGGKPIRRLAARVEELRKRGYHIESADRRNEMAVYRLPVLREFEPISYRWCLYCGHNPDHQVNGPCKRCGGTVVQLLARIDRAHEQQVAA